MVQFATAADVAAITAEIPWEGRDVPRTLYALLTRTRDQHGQKPALSFQLTSGPKDKAVTLSWAALHGQVTQAIHLLRRLGLGPGDVVAYILPNAPETVVTLLAGAACAIVAPVNPLLSPAALAGVLRETGAKAVVTLRPFPKTDLAARVTEALAEAPGVRHVIEVDLAPYLPLPQRLALALLRPKVPRAAGVTYHSFRAALAGEDAQAAPDTPPPQQGGRVCAYFQTGGSTGTPKIAQHRDAGMIYNGWLGAHLLFRANDTLLCPLPLFHVFAAYPALMSMLACGGHLVLPTPLGYRGKGVFENLWRLIERWQASYLLTVPTALSALMQRPVNADVGTLRGVFSGSAPMTLELFERFRAATGISVIEGYGLTEATCLVACNPPEGQRKIGSVGVPLPYTDVKIMQLGPSGEVLRPCGPEEVGEICLASPGTYPDVYRDPARNEGLMAEGRFLRTGDLGRLDAEGYLYITGRSKDLIIRGGHNIDPAVIEQALLSHPAVALAGAIGQPDAVAGEMPCAYVELMRGQSVSEAELLAHVAAHIVEKAAMPKHLEILAEMPKTVVGKVFKPDLRRRAITRVLNRALAAAHLAPRVSAVIEDRRRGLVAQILPTQGVSEAEVQRVIGAFAVPWEWSGPLAQEAAR